MNILKKKLLNFLMLGIFLMGFVFVIFFTPNVSTTLENNLLMRYFFLPLLISLVGVWAWTSGLFIGVERWVDRNQKSRHSYKSEKKLMKRISKIKSSAGLFPPFQGRF